MADQKEEEYVHKVYDEIAPHFSETRYKPWPIVSDFLMSRTTGSVGIDVGCGNGKYLNVNPNIFIIGSDRSFGLIQCAHELDGHYNVLVADGRCLPHRENVFDFAISIAVVHHWTTRERRVSAIKHILSKVKIGGQALIYCWALEQGQSRRGYHEGMEQDVLVPWVLQDKKKRKKRETNKAERNKPNLTGIDPKDREEYVAKWKEEQELKRRQEEKETQQQESEDVKYRFYHLYKKGELEEDCENAGGLVIRGGYEKDNWYVVVQKK